MKKRAVSKKKLNLLFILIIIILTVLTIYKIKKSESGDIYTKAAPSANNCSIVDPFLCEALSYLNEQGFLSQVFGGTVSSFDGSSHIERTWGQDSNGRSFQIIINEGKETDSIIYSPNEIYSKNINTGKWKKEIISNPERSSMIEQIGIEEDIEHFFNQDPNLSHYTFENKGTEICLNLSCVKYQAHDSLIPDDSNQEYLYFDSQTKKLLKYQKISNDFEIIYTFNLGTPLTIELPAVQE